MSMTAEGEAFYERCAQILSAVTDTLASFSSTKESPRGKLRLDMQVSLAKSLIIPALQDFQQRYPLIELVIGVGDRHVDMVNEGIDCVVRLGELKDSNLIVKKVRRDPDADLRLPGLSRRTRAAENPR